MVQNGVDFNCLKRVGAIQIPFAELPGREHHLQMIAKRRVLTKSLTIRKHQSKTDIEATCLDEINLFVLLIDKYRRPFHSFGVAVNFTILRMRTSKQGTPLRIRILEYLHKVLDICEQIITKLNVQRSDFLFQSHNLVVLDFHHLFLLFSLLKLLRGLLFLLKQILRVALNRQSRITKCQQDSSIE